MQYGKEEFKVDFGVHWRIAFDTDHNQNITIRRFTVTVLIYSCKEIRSCF